MQIKKKVKNINTYEELVHFCKKKEGLIAELGLLIGKVRINVFNLYICFGFLILGFRKCFKPTIGTDTHFSNLQESWLDPSTNVLDDEEHKEQDKRESHIAPYQLR
jgi:hypothetical protein